MNPAYMQPQQQQHPHYPGVQNPLPFGEANSNVKSNTLKGAPPNMQSFPPQKPVLGPGGLPPPPMQASFNANSAPVNTQYEPPTSSHMPPPPQHMLNQNSLVNNMSNMSLENQPRPPTSQPFQPHDKMPPLSTPSNLNGYNNATDPLPPDTGVTEKVDGMKSEAPNLNQNNNQQSYPPSNQPMENKGGAVPFNNAQQQYPSQGNEFNRSINQSTLLGHKSPANPQLLQQQNVSNPSPYGQPISGPPPGGQQNLMQGPMMGQQQFQQKRPGYPHIGQQNLPSSLSGPPGPSGPPLPPPTSLSTPPTQQNLLPSSPLSPGGGPPPSNQPNMSVPLMSGPPLPGQQQNLSGPPKSMPGPPLPGQQQQQYARPSPLGQLQPHLLPGQQQNLGSSGPVGGQRQYPAAPPLPGQTMGTHNRQSPNYPPGYPQQQQQQQQSLQQPNYQQQPQQQQPQPGYQNPSDMYGGQRGPYQGGMPGYQPGIQTQQTRRLDPDQMPSPICVMQDDQRTRGGVFATNQKGLVPPLVTTQFVVRDQGNASPRYIRSTMYTVPTTADIIKQTSIPFGLIISPMADVVEGEYEPPIVDMGDIGPIRCIRCKAYMSPFMQFIDAGRRFQCLFCKATTDVPSEYFQHLDHTGQRMDRFERPELILGTYEYITTKDYCRNNTLPKPPAIVFVIDVSYNTVKSGLVNLLCMNMKSIIKNLPVDVGQSRTNMKVGFITYNNTVHFYNINPCLAQPQMMVVGDVEDVFMPLLDGFLCDAEESEAVIDSLMTQIPLMFADTRETETILAPAIQAGLEALKASDCPGKLLVFHSSLPIAEAPGKLKNRDDRKVLGTEKEKTVLAPQNNIYNNLAQKCVEVGCSVDLFVFNNSYVDVATIGQVPRLTGGEIYKYTYFQADIDGNRLITDVMNNVSRKIAFDAVMRVRTSTGIRATDFYGHMFMSNTTDMELASIDSNKALAVEIKHDDKLTEEEGVYIQTALLYTSCGGIRRLRIINLSLKTSPQIAELFRTCDLDAIMNFLSKQSVFKLLESTPKAVKDNLIARCANILAAYRKHCASASSAGQLILPECMKVLPLYINSLLKSDAISGGADMTIDDKSYVMQAVTTMPVSLSVVFIYPRLLPLHDVDPQDFGLPQMLRCSVEKFTDDGAYLLENTVHMFLWLGSALSPQWVQAVFGVPSVMQVDTDQSILPVLDNPLNKRIHGIINEILSERSHCMRLTIVRQRDKLEMVLRHFLIEDRGNDGTQSYVDFLCHMHKEIRTLLSQ